MSTTGTDTAEQHAYDHGYRFVAQGLNLASYLDGDWDELPTEEQYETLHRIRDDLEGSILYERDVKSRMQALRETEQRRGTDSSIADKLEDVWWQGFADRVFGATKYRSLEQETDVHADLIDRGDSYELAADVGSYNAIDLYATVEDGEVGLYENGVIEIASFPLQETETADINVTEDDITNGVLTIELE